MRNRRRAPHEQRPGRAWADLPLRVKGLVVAIPLLALLLATVLFGVALAQDRRAQDAVLHSVEVERQIAHVRILVQAGVTGYVLTGERRYLTSYEAARQELPGPSPTSGSWSATTRARSTASPTSGPTGRRAAGSG